MRRDIAVIAAWMLVATATGCSFNVTATATDGGVDAPEGTPIVGFAQPGTLVDEESGAVAITVELSMASAAPATVNYAFADGTADMLDYTATDGVLTFAPGETVLTVPVQILADMEDEEDQTFTITLASPGGATLGVSSHTVTISANRLPRVSVSTVVTNAVESMSTMVVFTLDQPSPSAVSVGYTLGGTATAADHGLPATGVVTFAPNVTTEQRALAVVDDALDEDAETVIVDLDQPVGVVIMTAQTTYTIDDDDATPTVSFVAASSIVDEANTTLMLDVTLSAVSGRDVLVPFAPANGDTTATLGTDFTLVSPSPLMIPAGTQTVSLQVQINEDTIPEPDEAISIVLGTPTNATVGTIARHVVTITNDDPLCLGLGTFTVCAPALPTSSTLLGATFDTDSIACAAASVINWQTPAAQPAACFIYATTVTTSQNTFVTGSRPLVIVTSGSLTVSNTLDVASHRGGTTGPGAPSAACAAFPQAPGGSSGGGGGAGGSFITKGGNGGTGNGGGSQGGTSPAGNPAAPTVLRAGCDGQLGASSGSTPGAIGRGGGAVYLVAGGSLTISGAINASGSAGSGGGNFTGGSGAGAGGMIALHGATITATGATLMANGGGGAAGGDNNTAGASGADPIPPMPLAPALGGSSPGGGANGGSGFAGVPPGFAAGNGNNGASNDGGGGGGGAGGFIRANLVLTGAITSAGRVDAP